MPDCEKLADPKYNSRPSPPYHAQDCKGFSKKGNDGKTYMSIPNKKNIFTWKLAPLPKDAFLIHDNGGRPFDVEQFDDRIEVHARIAKGDDLFRGKTILKTPYEKFFVGEDRPGEVNDFGRGNSALIQVSKNKYIYVGSEIYSFAPIKGDTIRSYYSPIGNSDVPYPYAIGDTHTYIMLDAVAIPNELLDLKDDIYEQWYFEGTKRGCERTKRPTPYCRALLKDKAAVTRKLSIPEKRKTLKVKRIPSGTK